MKCITSREQHKLHQQDNLLICAHLGPLLCYVVTHQIIHILAVVLIMSVNIAVRQSAREQIPQVDRCP